MYFVYFDYGHFIVQKIIDLEIVNRENSRPWRLSTPEPDGRELLHFQNVGLQKKAWPKMMPRDSKPNFAEEELASTDSPSLDETDRLYSS